jgi:hypothetical protein
MWAAPTIGAATVSGLAAGAGWDIGNTPGVSFLNLVSETVAIDGIGQIN